MSPTEVRRHVRRHDQGVQVITRSRKLRCVKSTSVLSESVYYRIYYRGKRICTIRVSAHLNHRFRRWGSCRNRFNLCAFISTKKAADQISAFIDRVTRKGKP